MRNNKGKGTDIEKLYVYLISPTENIEEILTVSESRGHANSAHPTSHRLGHAAAFLSDLSSHSNAMLLVPSTLQVPFLSSRMCQSTSGCVAIAGKGGSLHHDCGHSGEAHISGHPTSF